MKFGGKISVTGKIIGSVYNPNLGPLMMVGTVAEPYLVAYNTDTWETIPGPSVAGAVQSVNFNPNGTLLAVGIPVSPYLVVYNVMDWSVVSGTPNPGATVTGLHFNNDGSQLVITYRQSASVVKANVYNTSTWSLVQSLESSGGNSKNSAGVAFNPDGSYIGLCYSGNSTPRINGWRTSDWGAITIASTPLPGGGNEVAFSSNRMAVTMGTASPGVRVYNVSSPTSWTVDANLTPGSFGYGVDFNPAGTLMGVSHLNTPFVTVYNTSGWTTVPGIPILPGGETTNSNSELKFNSDGSLMAVAHQRSPYITVYDTSNWSIVSGIAPLAGAGRSIAFK